MMTLFPVYHIPRGVHIKRRYGLNLALTRGANAVAHVNVHLSGNARPGLSSIAAARVCDATLCPCRPPASVLPPSTLYQKGAECETETIVILPAAVVHTWSRFRECGQNSITASIFPANLDRIRFVSVSICHCLVTQLDVLNIK